jgi:lysophospholipase L1-like esterase
MTTKILLFLFAVLAFYALLQYARTRHFIAIGTQLAREAAPLAYEQHPDAAHVRVLHIGDSSVVGTGSSDPRLSVAGRFGSDYPLADVVNLGVNGTKTGELIARFESIQDQRFDLIVVHTGGNDIVRYVSLEDLEKQLPKVLDFANNISDTVLLLHGGNVGTSYLFPAGTRWLFTKRTAQVRDVWMQIAQEKGVHYVDLWRQGNDDPFKREPKKYYAADGFHPSDDGYGDWYEHIHAVLQNTSFEKKYSE